MVTLGSAKPPRAGSIPARASIEQPLGYFIIREKINIFFLQRKHLKNTYKQYMIVTLIVRYVPGW